MLIAHLRTDRLLGSAASQATGRQAEGRAGIEPENMAKVSFFWPNFPLAAEGNCNQSSGRPSFFMIIRSEERNLELGLRVSFSARLATCCLARSGRFEDSQVVSSQLLAVMALTMVSVALKRRRQLVWPLPASSSFSS